MTKQRLRVVWEKGMADCKRKSFAEEWQAEVYIMEHPWPEPSPVVRAFLCGVCRKFHITDKPESARKGRHGTSKKRRGKVK